MKGEGDEGRREVKEVKEVKAASQITRVIAMQVIAILSDRIIQEAITKLHLHTSSKDPNFSVYNGSSMATTTFRHVSMSLYASPGERH